MSLRLALGSSHQPGRDLLPLSFKGVFVGTPAQHSFSPLLLAVQAVWPGCEIGDATLLMMLSRCTIILGKNT
jgi:hypothetical protein